MYEEDDLQPMRHVWMCSLLEIAKTTLDIDQVALQLIGFGLSLLVLSLLWYKVVRPGGWRRFWLLIALAWTMNLCAVIVWGVHDLIIGTELYELSVVDVLFAARYTLLGLALWLYPAAPPRRSLAWPAGAMLLVGVIVWQVYYHPLMDNYPGSPVNFLGYLLYPVMDSGLLVVAWLRCRAAYPPAWKNPLLLILLSVISYGLGNAINMAGYTFAPIAGDVLQYLLWPLADVLLLLAVISARKIEAP